MRGLFRSEGIFQGAFGTNLFSQKLLNAVPFDGLPNTSSEGTLATVPSTNGHILGATVSR